MQGLARRGIIDQVGVSKVDSTQIVLAFGISNLAEKNWFNRLVSWLSNLFTTTPSNCRSKRYIHYRRVSFQVCQDSAGLLLLHLYVPCYSPFRSRQPAQHFNDILYLSMLFCSCSLVIAKNVSIAMCFNTTTSFTSLAADRRWRGDI